MKLIITEATMDLIRKQTLPGHAFKQTATHLPDGRWELAVEQDVLDRINAERVPGESDDDALARVTVTVHLIMRLCRWQAPSAVMLRS